MYPDIIALLVAYLQPIVTPVKVVARVPDPRPTRLLQLRRVGGTQLRPVRDRPRVDVITWDDDEPGAMALAELARRSIGALQATTTLGPMVYRVDEFLSPTQTDDPVTGSPRVLVTYSITIRADDAIAR